MAGDKEKKTGSDCCDSGVKKRPPKEVIDKMNRIIKACNEAGKPPGELADEIYRKMFV